MEGLSSGMEFKNLIEKQLAALVACDFEAFLANGTAYFKSLEKKDFDSVSAQISAPLKTGYDILYLGELQQQGHQVTLWKISLKQGGDDLLATMYVKEGKVSGFLIK
jgi:hypothetical protein